MFMLKSICTVFVSRFASGTHRLVQCSAQPGVSVGKVYIYGLCIVVVLILVNALLNFLTYPYVNSLNYRY
jgi:hypothetical protein